MDQSIVLCQSSGSQTFNPMEIIHPTRTIISCWIFSSVLCVFGKNVWNIGFNLVLETTTLTSFVFDIKPDRPNTFSIVHFAFFYFRNIFLRIEQFRWTSGGNATRRCECKYRLVDCLVHCDIVNDITASESDIAWLWHFIRCNSMDHVNTVAVHDICAIRSTTLLS